MVFNHAILNCSCRHHLLNSAKNGLCSWVIIYLLYSRCLSFLLVLQKWPHKDLHDSAELVYEEIREKQRHDSEPIFSTTQRGRGTIEGLTIEAASDHDILRLHHSSSTTLLTFMRWSLLTYFVILWAHPCLSISFGSKRVGCLFFLTKGAERRNYVYCTKCIL